MFAAIAADDFLFRGEFGVIESWFDAGRPVEFHLYQNGGHGFGLRQAAGKPVAIWPELWLAWARTVGLAGPGAETGA